MRALRSSTLEFQCEECDLLLSCHFTEWEDCLLCVINILKKTKTGWFSAGWLVHFQVVPFKPVCILPSAKVCISANFSMLKGSLMDLSCCFVITMMWWVQFEITSFLSGNWKILADLSWTPTPSTDKVC